ncbi:MAG: lytic murein transglycosylase [Solirubrobacteraceae bacterium]|nr:lytic murein transglycosylase [Solirubrobacteraceae bacterium]
MKSSSLGPLIALSALAVAPSVAFGQEASTTPVAPSSVAITPEPAPALTPEATQAPPASTPVETPASTTPQAVDPETDVAEDDDSPEGRAEKRRKARETQAERDPEPTGQATDSDLIDPSSLTVTAVPNFFIEDFDIPPFLLPIYQAAGSEYGIRWEVLAAINRIETDFGRNLNVSSAGALGWMQFMPATWETYGVDANDDGVKDPFNPADAIFAAARYLKAAGGDKDLRKAVFAYNHADWYVDDVLEGARSVAAIPESLISSLTGLTQGIFPVDAPDAEIDYAGKTDFDRKGDKVKANENAADPVKGSDERNSIEISADGDTRVVATQDGVVEKVGETKRLGKFVRVRDSYGNRYTYGHLGEVQDQVPVPKPSKSKEGLEDEIHAESEDDTAPTTAATEGAQTDLPVPTTPGSDTSATPSNPVAPEVPTETASPADEAPAPAEEADKPVSTTVDPAVNTTPTASEKAAAAPAEKRERLTAKGTEKTAKNKAYTPRRIRYSARNASGAVDTAPEPIDGEATRLYAHPSLPDAFEAGGEEQLNPTAGDDATSSAPVGELSDYFSIDYGLKATDVNLKKLKAGQAIIAGTVLGKTKLALDGEGPSKVTFEIRPAGKKAPRIDPQPILDGWRQSDKTDFLAAQAKKAVKAGESDDAASVGQILLMSKAELTERVLSDKRITIYEGGRNDIKGGVIDRRILALLEVLAEKGVQPTVTSLRSGHGTMTSSGNVSQHTTGTAVDIATAYGTVISPATQGEGSVTDRAVREILELQGNMKPDQIITLMTYEGEENTLAMSDHDDHIHVGYRPTTGVGGKQLEQLLKPGQWDALVNQLSTIQVPNVSAKPSEYSVSVDKTKKSNK